MLNRIKSKINDYFEEKDKINEIKKRAKFKAIEGLEDDLVEVLKEKELNKIKKQSIPFGEKMSKAFSNEGFFSDEKMDRMLGNTTKKSEKSDNNDIQDKIKRMLN